MQSHKSITSSMRRAYSMRAPVRSKKMAVPERPGKSSRLLDISGRKWSASIMADRIFPVNRRELMAGLGAATLGAAIPPATAAQERPSLMLRAKTGFIALRPGEADTPVWSLEGPTSGHFKRGEELAFTLQNDLPAPAVLNWHGLHGVPAVEPLAVRGPLAPGGMETFMIPTRHAGTFMTDLRLLSDTQAPPSRGWVWLVGESEPVNVDRDEVLLFEDWRLKPDGTAIAPGVDPTDTKPVYTANAQTTLDIPTRANERLRLRFINGFQRNVIAIKLEKLDLHVMAIDGQPAEPFPARDSVLVLAPGTRVDAFVDMTSPSGSTSSILLHDGTEARPIARLITSGEAPIRTEPLATAPPLPSNGLPEQLDLKNALRFDLNLDLNLGGPQADWATPVNFTKSDAPAFHAKTGRTVVLALTNRADIATVFHLHGHHFRLLDRLDDGWKPFWLDTLAIQPGQTQRVAFLAEFAGHWLMEAIATAWAAPRLVRWYSVE
jgi:FtsP/CotA-like multicopper oxidase with cupredoxin domain